MRSVLAPAGLAVALAAAAASPASAATIVQTRSLAGVQPFDGFSAALGTLNAVTLAVTGTTYRQGFVSTPAGSPPNTITWTVNSYYNVLGAPGAGSPLRVNTLGGGTLVQNAGVFDFSAKGSATFALATSAFIDAAPFLLAISDPGLSLASESGTSFSPSTPSTVFQTLGTCRFGSTSTQCGLGGATLTFDFTPFAVGAVPEPATWATMLLGFGAVGYSLRRRRAAVRTARTA